MLLNSVQFSSVAQSCPTLCDPMNRSTPGLPVHHQLLEFTQTHVHPVSDAIQPSHPLSSPSPLAPKPSQHQSLFQWINSSHEVAKVLEFPSFKVFPALASFLPKKFQGWSPSEWTGWIYTAHLLHPFIGLLWTLGSTYLLELEFSPDTCPGVGLLDPMVTLVVLKSFFKYTSELFSVYISIYKNRIAIFLTLQRISATMSSRPLTLRGGQMGTSDLENVAHSLRGSCRTESGWAQVCWRLWWSGCLAAFVAAEWFCSLCASLISEKTASWLQSSGSLWVGVHGQRPGVLAAGGPHRGGNW